MTIDPWLLGVGVLGATVRLIYFVEAGDDPTFQHPIIDCSEYDALARTLAQGHSPWPGALTRPPLYPLLLAAIYYLSGVKLTAAYVVHALIGGLNCALTCVLGRRLFDRGVGLAAGVAVAFYGPMVFFDMRLLASSLDVCCYLTALLLALRAVSRATHAAWLLCGLSTGLAALTRPTIAPPFLLVLAIWLVWRGFSTVVWHRFSTGEGTGRQSAPAPVETQCRTGHGAPVQRAGSAVVPRRAWKRHMVALFLLALGSMMPIVPVAVRNYHASGDFIPIATLGAMNLYIGNNPEWRRTVAIRPGFDWNRLNRLPHANGHVSAAGKEAYFMGRVADYVRNQPGAFIGGLLHKAREYANGRETPRNFDIYTHRGFSHVLSALVWRAGPLAFPFGLLLPLAVVGFVVGCRDRPGMPIAGGFVLAAAFSVILFFNGGRYRMPIVPVLAVLAVWGVVWMWRALAARRTRSFAVGLGAAAIVGVAVNLPAPASTDGINFEAELYDSLAGRFLFENDLAGAARAWQKALDLEPNSPELLCNLSHVTAQLGRAGEAVRLARRAVELAPESADARLTLGSALVILNVPDAAQAELTRALRIEPGHPVAHSVLGQLLASQGQTPEGIDELHRSLHFDNTDPATYLALSKLLVSQRLYRDALTALEQGVDLVRAPDLIDALAWLLAACPDDAVRDPARAVRLADRNVTDTKERNPVYLDTLAAAHAASGKFDQAVTRATQAVTIARNAGAETLANSISARRRLYQAEQGCTDPVR